MPENKVDPIVLRVQKWEQDSNNLLTDFYHRWAESMRLMKGIWPEKERNDSAVRKRSKIYFRKIWSTVIRLQASMFEAFLKNPGNSFSIEGRDRHNDTKKATILQYMVEYRIDLLNRRNGLFKKLIWAFNDILSLGVCVGKWSWETDRETGKDGPVFDLYPMEQVRPDLKARTLDEMRYIIFINYMDKDKMESLGYQNLDKVRPSQIPSNQVRNIRFSRQRDPKLNSYTTGNNVYPPPGTFPGEKKDVLQAEEYRVVECFYWEKGTLKYVVTDGQSLVLEKEGPSPYGNRLLVTMGECLSEPHKLYGQGFPEPLEGPEMSYNDTLNKRKDNVALSLNPRKIVNRFGGVDLKSLANSKPGGLVLADDTDAIADLQVPDVTGSAYAEANADVAMMQDMSGVTQMHLGQGKNEKATVATINQAEGNAKINLYISMVAESFMRKFYSDLAYLIQNFETDETVIRVANDRFVEEFGDVYNGDVIDFPFEADCIINLGLNTGSELNQAFIAMDKAILANQSTLALASVGMAPPGGPVIFDTSKFMTLIISKMNFRHPGSFVMKVPQPQPQGQPGQGAPGVNTGALQPQPGSQQVV